MRDRDIGPVALVAALVCCGTTTLLAGGLAAAAAWRFGAVAALAVAIIVIASRFDRHRRCARDVVDSTDAPAQVEKTPR